MEEVGKTYYSNYFKSSFVVTKYISDDDWYFKLPDGRELKAQSKLSLFKTDTKSSMEELKDILIKYDDEHHIDLEVLGKLEEYISTNFIPREEVERIVDSVGITIRLGNIDDYDRGFADGQNDMKLRIKETYLSEGGHNETK
jgi:Cu/Ag efflux pump CusA